MSLPEVSNELFVASGCPAHAIAPTLPEGDTYTRPQFCRPVMLTVQAMVSLAGDTPTKRPSPTCVKSDENRWRVTTTSGPIQFMPAGHGRSAGFSSGIAMRPVIEYL